MAPKIEAVAKFIIIDCPKAGRQWIGIEGLKKSDGFFYVSSGECDLCGSHGHVSLHFECKCGTWHKVEFHTW